MDILPKCFGFTNSKHTSLSAIASQSSPSTQIEELCHRFPLPLLQKLTGNFDESRITGTGPFYDVYKACINTKVGFHEVAIKKLKSKFGLSLTEFKNEIQMLCQLRHPNLIRLIGFCEDGSRKIVVVDYMPNGSLNDQLFNKKREPLSWKRRLQICIGTARGLHYLHSGVKRTIFHRKVQPVSIFLDKDFVPKLGNFAFSLEGPHSMSKPKPKNLDKIVGSIGYTAPECYRDFMFTDKCDVYSFGMVLLVVVLAMHPMQIVSKILQLEDQNVNEDESESELFEDGQRIAKLIGKFLLKGKTNMIIDPFLMGKIAPQCWKSFLDIVERCLLGDPTERPSMGEVEVELEQALTLQEEADAINPAGYYSLSSI